MLRRGGNIGNTPNGGADQGEDEGMSREYFAREKGNILEGETWPDWSLKKHGIQPSGLADKRREGMQTIDEFVKEVKSNLPEKPKKYVTSVIGAIQRNNPKLYADLRKEIGVNSKIAKAINKILIARGLVERRHLKRNELIEKYGEPMERFWSGMYIYVFTGPASEMGYEDKTIRGTYGPRLKVDKEIDFLKLAGLLNV